MAWRGYCRTLVLLFLAAGLAPGFAQSVSSNPSGLELSFPQSVPSSPSGAVHLLGPDFMTYWAQEQRQEVLTHRLKELAGKDAVDCGRAPAYQNPTFRTDCALEAFAAKKAFYVRYEMGIFDIMDDEVIIGFVAPTPQRIVELVYRLDGWPLTGEHLSAKPCPDPVNLVRTPGGRLSCFQTRSDSGADIFSSSWY